jgi:DNA-binding CsgD family transcriptional regulator
VRNHVRNVLTKLQARTKLEAVVIAARSGLVDLRPEA